jgi:hypothetical protein
MQASPDSGFPLYIYSNLAALHNSAGCETVTHNKC